MRMIITLCLTLTVTALLGLVVAEPALAAEPVWQTCTNLEAEIGNFENSLCTKEKTGGTHEWLEVAEATSAVAEGELTLTDTETIVGEVKIKCKVTGEGKIGPGAEGKIEVTLSSCSSSNGLCTSPTVVAVHLPWKTMLKEETGGEIRDSVKNSGAGIPGYEATCSSPLGKQHDTCEGETSAKTSNLSEGLVEATFESKSAKAKCTQSKAETGSIAGTLKIKQVGGAALRAAVPWVTARNADLGGPGEAAGAGTRMCIFVAAGEKCKIEFSTTRAAIEVRSEGIAIGVNPKVRYNELAHGCALFGKVFPCEDEVEAKKIERPSVNSYCLVAEDKATGRNVPGCAELRMP